MNIVKQPTKLPYWHVHNSDGLIIIDREWQEKEDTKSTWQEVKPTASKEVLNYKREYQKRTQCKKLQVTNLPNFIVANFWLDDFVGFSNPSLPQNTHDYTSKNHSFAPKEAAQKYLINGLSWTWIAPIQA